MNSQYNKTLERSLRIVRPGGLTVSISGPPDPEFAREKRLALPLRWLMSLLSAAIRRQAKRLGGQYAFLFTAADGAQLSKITPLIEHNIIRPVIDRVFPFEATNEALAYVETGRAKGKVVIRVK